MQHGIALMKQINLIPEQYLVRRAAARHAVCWGVGLSGLLLIILTAAGWHHQRLAYARKTLDSRTRAVEAIEPLVRQINQLAIERTRLQQRLARVQLLLRRKYRSAILTHIAQCINDDVVLTTLTFHSPYRQDPVASSSSGSLSRRSQVTTHNGSAEEPDGSAETTLVLKGYALSDVELTRFIASLREGSVLQDVRLDVAEQAPGHRSGLKSFEIRCIVPGGEPANESAQG